MVSRTLKQHLLDYEQNIHSDVYGGAATSNEVKINLGETYSVIWENAPRWNTEQSEGKLAFKSENKIVPLPKPAVVRTQVAVEVLNSPNWEKRIVHILDTQKAELKKFFNIQGEYVGMYWISEPTATAYLDTVEISMFAQLVDVSKLLHEAQFTNKLEDLING